MGRRVPAPERTPFSLIPHDRGVNCPASLNQPAPLPFAGANVRNGVTAPGTANTAPPITMQTNGSDAKQPVMTQQEVNKPHGGITVTVGGARIEYLNGGSGAPLLWLHGTEGNLGWLRLHDELARNFTVYVPTHPGFAGSERPLWLESFIDLSRFYLWIVQELGLSRVTLAGHFIGGWLAAEMAIMSPQIAERLVLIDAAGIKPNEGEITDIFLHGLVPDGK